MTATAKKRATIELPGKLAPKQKQAIDKLRSLESSEEDASILLFEAVQAANQKHHGKSPNDVEITRYSDDVFRNEPLTYPRLFSPTQILKMTRSDLVTELSVIIAMAHQHDLASGPYIYSIQVLEPRDMTGFVNPEKLQQYFGGRTPPDIKSGYIYGSLLYDAPEFLRNVVLEGVLGSANEVEVAFRNPSSSIVERKHVELSQT